jgi:hypothetical protein
MTEYGLNERETSGQQRALESFAARAWAAVCGMGGSWQQEAILPNNGRMALPLKSGFKRDP